MLSIHSTQCINCHEVKYCSKDCQRADWAAGHRKSCNKKGPNSRPYVFHEPDLYTSMERQWHVDEILNGPDQPMDPPDTEDYEFALSLWK